MKVREICKFYHLKYMGKKVDTNNLKSSLRIAPKNLKKFVVIYYEKMYLHAYFHIFLSSRVLKRKIFLIIDFSPCYFNGELRPLGGGRLNRSNWTLSPWGLCFIIFFKTFYMVTLMKKSIWEIRNTLIYMLPDSKINIGIHLKVY